MSSEESSNLLFEKFVAKEGLDGLKERIARGDFVGERLTHANAFVTKKEMEALVQYQLGPEYSALRAANAAEKANSLMAEANKTAQSARRIAGIAILVSLLALIAQIFDVKL